MAEQERVPGCRVTGCCEPEYQHARGAYAHLCFDHYVERSEQIERTWAARRDAGTLGALVPPVPLDVRGDE